MTGKYIIPFSFSVLLFLLCLTDDPADGYNQVLDVKRLLNKGIEPLPDGLRAVRVPRHCNEGDLRVALLHFLEERPSVHAGQPEVAQDQIGQFPLQHAKRLPAVLYDNKDVAFPRQGMGNQPCHQGVIFDQENTGNLPACALFRLF